MAYKYKTTTDSSGYIEYDIRPDLLAGGAFTAGDTIIITGSLHNTFGRVDGIRLTLSGDSAANTVADISFSSAKGSDKSFTMTFSAPDLSSTLSGTARAKQFTLLFSLPYINGAISPSPITLSSTGKISYIRYRLEPNISSLALERCDSSGAADNEGTYLRFRQLKLTKSARASVSDFTVFDLSWESSSGGSGSIHPTGPFSQALTSSGYSETGRPSANLFGTRQFLTTTDYNVTLTVGDAYDTFSMTVVVPRAFAILHLSGAKDGGVAVGMFSSATDGNPMFEVAENHRSIFYGPVEFRGEVSGGGSGNYTSGEVATGSKWIDGKPIYRFVWTGSTTKAGTNEELVTLPSTVETMISINGFVLRDNGSQFRIGHVAYNSNNYNVASWLGTSNQLMLALGTSITGTKKIVIVAEYTIA